MPNELPPEADKIIGAKPQGRMMDARQAVATMSEGFLLFAAFMADEVGVPRDAMMHGMKLAQKYGLCIATNGINPQGKPFVHYVNPYADFLKPKPQIITPDTKAEGEA